jgi:AhpC/TSA family protein
VNFNYGPTGPSCGEEEQLEIARTRKRLAGLLLGMCLAGAVCWPKQMQAAGPDELKLKVGDTAPNFKLQYFDGKDVKDVSLNDYRGKKNVVLAFYIFAFTGG